jgi:hypothetical protein
MTQNLAHAIGAYRVAAMQVHPLVAVVKLFDETLRRIALTISSVTRTLMSMSRGPRCSCGGSPET